MVSDEILTEAENADTKAFNGDSRLPPDSIELLQALKTAYCFILPSRHEPFGIAALEALMPDCRRSLLLWVAEIFFDGENALL